MGGLVSQWLNEVRDALGDITSMAYKEVVRKPLVRVADDESKIPVLNLW